MPGFKSVVVKDGHVAEFSHLNDEDYSWSLATLVANWNTSGTGEDVVRYDWSVGIQHQPPGTGLIDRQLEPIWTDAGHSTQAVFTLKRPRGNSCKLFCITLVKPVIISGNSTEFT